MPAELKSNEEWREWGSEDPMYGVASWEGRKQDSANPWTTKEFYELGKSDWEDFLPVWEGFQPPARGTVLEIGSGAGRITNQLADYFSDVKAVDVSPGMIEFAKTNVHKPNVEWLLSDGLHFPVADKSVQAIFSVHVFQHFDNVDAILSNLDECARILEPGGTLFIHLQIHTFPEGNKSFSKLARRGYALFLKATAIKAERKRAAMRKGTAEPYMHGVSIERSALHDHITKIGFDRSVMVSIFPRLSNAHSVLIARKG